MHGLFDPLKSLLERIRQIETPEDPAKIIFLGNYIDHGPSSKEVMDLVMRLDMEKVCLVGNHEDMALRFIKQDKPYLEYYANMRVKHGLVDTCNSI
ncbi:MAG: metallophosphoesterase [Deltaproteobacteria bacterium]|nr:metallophosphoesterase [Deltaproteobacteria bacterium]